MRTPPLPGLQAGRKPHAHSDYVRGPIFLHGLEGQVDVMIEAKCKVGGGWACSGGCRVHPLGDCWAGRLCLPCGMGCEAWHDSGIPKPAMQGCRLLFA